MASASMSSTRIKRMEETLEAIDAAAERTDGRAMLNLAHALMHDLERLVLVATLLLERDAA